jgi:hypothetical protein
VWVEYFAAHISEPKIVEVLGSTGIIIARTEVSNLLSKQQEPMHEKDCEHE